MLHVVTLLWDANDHSQWFSRCYDETWVERLRDGFQRNLARPFRFIVFTDRERKIPGCDDILLSNTRPQYGDCIEPFCLNKPMILCGLDTVVTGNCDELANYCMTADTVALPRDPYHRERSCNGVCLVPARQRAIYDEWNGENDMEWLRKQPHKFIDDLFPGMVESYKGTVKKYGLRNEKIVYFHGDQKPHQLLDTPWIRKHWLGEAAHA